MWTNVSGIGMIGLGFSVGLFTSYSGAHAGWLREAVTKLT
jgi:hypothetical protein